ncbi:MAG: hypothetical protein KA419_02140 [Acidobacteria bacterium]|nr:hypothetical protein [Acidobacteriota bacterium]
MEGNVYLCSWKKGRAGFEITLLRDDTVTARGNSLSEAEGRMVELLCERFGDGEAVIDYDRPLPDDTLPARYTKPAIYLIRPNDGVHSLPPEKSGPDGGLCTACGNRRRGDPSTPPRYNWLPAGSDGALDWKQTGDIFSDAFVSLLPEEAREGLRFRAVDYVGRQKLRTRFSELVGSPAADFVYSNRIPLTDGFRCRRCGFTQALHTLGGILVRCLARNDLPAPCPPAFVAKTLNNELYVCMTGELWRRVQCGKGTRNLLGTPVCMLDPEEVVRVPTVPESYQEGRLWITDPPGKPNVKLAEKLCVRHTTRKTW